MLSIHLHHLKFHAYHGIHEEEKILGNNFEINVDVQVKESGRIESIHQTVNYVTVYHEIKKRMQQPTHLLETVAQDMVELIHAIDDRIRFIKIDIKKLHPPIAGFEGAVGVSYSKQY